jgi:hypothetical protein
MSYKIISKVMYNENEEQLIKDFFNLMSANFEDFKLAGFNFHFDLKNLLFKALKYNVMAMNFFPTKKWDYIDIRELLSYGDSREKGTLDDYLKAFGMEGKYNGYNGASVQGLYDSCMIDEIIKYSKQDAQVEMKLLLKIMSLLKHNERLDRILVIDIETIVKPDVIDVNVLRAQKLEELQKQYKQQKTIDKYMEEFENKISNGEYKADYVFDKFKNQVISISYSYLVPEEDF